MTDLPRSARVVVIGGGISGCSVAYHLTALGWTADPATESFLRDGERAQLHVESAEPGARIVIDIQPVAQPAR